MVAGVSLYGGPNASALLSIAEASPFHLEYNTMTFTVEIVEDIFAAIDHIHQRGRYACLYTCLFPVITAFNVDMAKHYFPCHLLSSDHLSCSAHADCIITEDDEAAELFLNKAHR